MQDSGWIIEIVEVHAVENHISAFAAENSVFSRCNLNGNVFDTLDFGFVLKHLDGLWVNVHSEHLASCTYLFRRQDAEEAVAAAHVRKCHS